MLKQEWRSFCGTHWLDDVDVRDFIQDNYTPYDGDESFLEKPTQATEKLWGMLQDLHKQGNTVVLITHDNSIAVQAERIIRLEDGRVVYDGDAHAPEAVVQPNFMMAEPKAGEEGTQA